MAYYKVIKARMVDGSVSDTTIGYIEESSKTSFEGFHTFDSSTFVSSGNYYYLLDTTSNIDGLSLVTDLENPEG